MSSNVTLQQALSCDPSQEFADVKLLHVDRLFADPWGPEPGPEGPPIKPESRWRFWSRGLAYPLTFNVRAGSLLHPAGVRCPFADCSCMLCR